MHMVLYILDLLSSSSDLGSFLVSVAHTYERRWSMTIIYGPFLVSLSGYSAGPISIYDSVARSDMKDSQMIFF